METLTRAYLSASGKRFSTARALFALRGFQLHRVRVIGNPMSRYFAAKNLMRADFDTLADAEEWLNRHKARGAALLAADDC